jgi:hypothetical protein
MAPASSSRTATSRPEAQGEGEEREVSEERDRRGTMPSWVLLIAGIALAIAAFVWLF